MGLPPVALPHVVSDELLHELDHRIVYATGRFLHEREMRVLPRYFEDKLGLYVFTPLRRSDGTTIIINRGWVPADLKDGKDREEAQLTETVTVMGHLIGSEDGVPWILGGGSQPIVQKSNVPDRNLWVRVDLKQMGEWVNAQPVLISALASPPNPGGYPIGGQTDFKLDNWKRTLSYEIFAVSACMMAALFGSRFATRLGYKLPWLKPPPPHTPFTET